MAIYTLTDGTRKTQLTISGDTTVVFPTKLDYFGVRSLDGANILVSKIKAPTVLEDGVYSTDEGDGDVVVDDGVFTDTLYLKGSGTVVVYGGAKSNHLPFKVGGKGGGGSGGDNTHYKGTTTTAISNGSTTNPITIDGEEYTAVFGDIVVYGYTEFVFDGTAWSEFGRPFDTTPTSGSANAVTSDGIKTALDTKQNIMQYAAMPTITASMLGKVVQYVGTSDSNYKQGWNYVAVSDGAAEPTYSWQALMDSAPTSGSNNPVTSNGLYWSILGKAGGGSGHAVKFGNWDNSYAAGYSAFTAGNGCSASGNCSVALNDNTRSNQQSMTAIGKFNSPRTGDLFNVGNGTANNARSNILEVNSAEMNVNGDIKRDGVGIDDYTTTERKIGKWIDGEDLYQRTFEVTGLSKNTWNNSILDTSDIKIVDFTGLIYWLDNQEASDTTPLNYYASGSDNCFTCINTVQTDMRIYPTNTSSSMSIGKAVITIKYTKPSVQANTLNANIQQTEEPTDEMR